MCSAKRLRARFRKILLNIISRAFFDLFESSVWGLNVVQAFVLYNVYNISVLFYIMFDKNDVFCAKNAYFV